MYDLTNAPETDPTPIYRHRDALYASDMLIVALKGLDLFSFLARQPQSVETICKHFQIFRRPTDVMTTLLVASGWLQRRGESLEVTRQAREYLVQDSPWFIGPYFPPVADRPIALDLLQCLKTDQPAKFNSRKDHEDWHRAMESETFAKEFTAMMDCRGVLLAQALAKSLPLTGRRRLLDVGGGSGIFACTICAHQDQLMATVFEKSPVDQIAAAAIADRGYQQRVQTIVGDMFLDQWPEGHDLHLLSNVVHDWDEADVWKLLKKSAESLTAGGLLVVHDTFLNADKTGPLHVAEYSVLLMHVTQGRCYSDAEITEIAREAGFDFVRQVPSAATRSGLIFSANGR